MSRAILLEGHSRASTTLDLKPRAELATNGQVGAAGRWARPIAGWLRVVVVVLGAVVLLWGNEVTLTRLWWSLALVLLLLAAVQILAGAGRAAGAAQPAPHPVRRPAKHHKGGRCCDLIRFV